MKSALVVLFNQDYSKNIPKIERIYAGRFSCIVYLVPDYWSRLHRVYTNSYFPMSSVCALDRSFNSVRRFFGRCNPHELDKVTQKKLDTRFQRVTGHQFFFYDFVRQAANYLLALDVEWFWVVGDDAILNPVLNESSLPQAVSMDGFTEAVICCPVISSDAWLKKIAGSVDSAQRRLESVLGPLSVIHNRHCIEKEKGAVENTDVAVACADFFGISHQLLRELVPIWCRCMAKKLYVELTIPNSVLAVAESPVLTDRFFWIRTNDIHEGGRLLDRFREDPECIFVHPVKLSVISDSELGGMRN